MMSTTTQTTAAAMVADARDTIDNLPVDQVTAELATDQPLLVDIRETEELSATGKIVGAVHAPRGMLEFYADPASPYHRPEFDPNRRVILYCASSGRSALAVKTLQALGYRDIAHLDGGIKSWTAAGQPLEPA
jgi:rhodanese-related sulfurtransferase